MKTQACSQPMWRDGSFFQDVDLSPSMEMAGTCRKHAVARGPGAVARGPGAFSGGDF